MSGLSPVQTGGSPISGGVGAMSGWVKVGIAAAVVAGIAALIVLPGLGGYTGRKSAAQDTQRHTASSAPIGFTPASIVPPPVLPVPSTAAPPRHRRPPPLNIAAFDVPDAVSGMMGAAGVGAGQQAGGAGDGSAGGGGAGPDGGGLGGTGGQQGAAGGAGGGALAGQLGGTVSLHATHATVLKHPDYVITAGNKVPCIAVDAMAVQMGGFVSCRVPEWVRGTTERRGILPPGTLIFGQVKGGLQQGVERVGIVFTRIETAGDHMIIPLSAPGADELGRFGADGDVKTHFWDTLGAVAMYAMIDAAQQTVQMGGDIALNNAINRSMPGGGAYGGGGVYLNTYGNGSSSLAQTALGSRLNRPPELDRDQGLPLYVSVGQDLDFYAACHDRQKVNPMACPRQ